MSLKFRVNKIRGCEHSVDLKATEPTLSISGLPDAGSDCRMTRQPLHLRPHHWSHPPLAFIVFLGLIESSEKMTRRNEAPFLVVLSPVAR